VRRWTTLAVLAVVAPVLGLAAPAHANVDSWAHVWDKNQTVSTSGNAIFVFPRKADCPANFHVAVSWVKWGYSSPEGPSVRLKWIKLRLKPNHKMFVALDGERKKFPPKKYTTRKYNIDTSGDFPLLKWDGGNQVPVFIDDTWYAPNMYKDGLSGVCKQPLHHAGLRRHF